MGNLELFDRLRGAIGGRLHCLDQSQFGNEVAKKLQNNKDKSLALSTQAIEHWDRRVAPKRELHSLLPPTILQ